MKDATLFRRVKEAAAGRWEEIIFRVTGCDLPPGINKNGPCPKCGGTDRAHRKKDFDETGYVYCRGCEFTHSGADGIHTVQWLNNIPQPVDAAKLIADHLGISFEKKKSSSTIKFEMLSESDHVNDDLKAMTKDLITNNMIPSLRSVTIDGLKKVPHFQIGRIKFSWNNESHNELVFAVPRLNEKLEPNGRWVMFRLDGRKIHIRNSEVRKVNTSTGSEGITGSVNGDICILTEGESDLFAVNSAIQHPNFTAFTTGGTESRIPGWLKPMLAKKTVVIIYDNTEQAQKSADKKAFDLASSNNGIKVKIVTLPSAKKGEDLREWLVRPGCDWQSLHKAIETADFFKVKKSSGSAVLDDYDPRRIAIANLKQYQENGRRLIYWRNRWFRYKTDHYAEISLPELKVKVQAFMIDEYLRIWKEIVDNWTKANSDPPDSPDKVTSFLVNEVIQAMKIDCLVRAEVPFPGWLDNPDRSPKNIIPLKNGLIDIDEVVLKYTASDAKNIKSILKDHTSNFFSSVCLDYEFQGIDTVDIYNTTFHKFLRESFPEKDGAAYRIVLQQFLGYLLVQDNTYSKFLLMHGDGANGKSVFCTVVKALLGSSNCAASSLERLNSRFEASFFHDKLVNIIDEASNIDPKTLDCLKRLTGGGTLQVEEKGKSAFQKQNTCRFIICCNQIPNFNDQSDGTYRRILVVPWENQISRDEATPGISERRLLERVRRASSYLRLGTSGIN